MKGIPRVMVMRNLGIIALQASTNHPGQQVEDRALKGYFQEITEIYTSNGSLEGVN